MESRAQSTDVSFQGWEIRRVQRTTDAPYQTPELDGVANELYVSAAAGTDAAWLILYTWWAFNKYVLSE